MDVDAVIARKPELALVDELAHTNARERAQRQALRGHRGDPRRRNRRHLDRQHPAPREPERRGLRAHRRARARDVPRPHPRRGRRGRARRPDPGGAPGAAREPGKVYAPGRAEAALENFFRLDNLSALRELVLRELAEDVEARRMTSVLDPLSQQAVAERILVLVTPGAALAADPAPRLPLRPAPQLGDRRALGAPPGPGADASRRPSRSPRCAGSRASSAPTSSSSKGTTFVETVKRVRRRARLDLRLPRHARRVAAHRDLARLARLEARARAARDRHPGRRRPRAARGRPRVIERILIAALAAGSDRCPGRPANRAGRRCARASGGKRILVPFTGGALDPTVLAAAIRIARAEEATLVPAYLIVVPLEFSAEAPMRTAGRGRDAAARSGRARRAARWRSGRRASRERPVRRSMRSSGSGTPSGSTASSCRRRSAGAPGFTPKDLAWMLTHAPSETLILRPDPVVEIAATSHDESLRTRPSEYGSRVRPVSSR